MTEERRAPAAEDRRSASLAAIDLRTDPRARAFAFDGAGERGCLLVHGFTGAPWELRPVGERLAARGYAVVAPRLPGHGTVVEDLATTRWEDWFAATEAAWRELGEKARVRVAAGLSMGAMLVIHLARLHADEVRAAALLAPAVRLRNQRLAEQALWLSRLPVLPRRLAIFGKANGGASPPPRPAYAQVPVRALASMIRLQRVVLAELSDVRVPALVVDGGRDLTVAPEAGALVEAALGSPIKRRIVFPESGHILPEDVSGAEVVDAVEKFFDEVVTAERA